MKSYINVCDVEKYYGSAAGMTKAVDRVSFQVSEGEFVGVMGASGSGKTTLLNMLATIDSVTAGHIYYQETDITELKPDQLAKFRKENLGFVFQEYNLLLLLADEPTGALDFKAAETLLETFQSLNASKRATIFMVTHDAFSASYCSRILFLKDGRIFHELIRGQKGRREFLNAILDVLSATGGVKDAR